LKGEKNMKKALFMLLILNSFSAYSIQKPNLDLYYKQKKIGSILGDFNKINETFEIGYSKDEKFNINNRISFGYFTHDFKYNTAEKKTLNTISVSKNLRDFAISKKQEILNDYYVNKDKLMNDYYNALDIYSNLIIKKHEISYLTDTISKIKSDKKILETQYKAGVISKIDYDTVVVDLLAYQNKVNILKNDIIELLDSLKQYGFEEKIENIKDFEIKNLDKEKLTKYIEEENYKIKLDNDLIKQKKLHSYLPDINVGANYQFETKNYGVSLNINKLFTLDGSDVVEANLNYVPNKKSLNLKNEMAKYELLYRTYIIDEKKEFLASETYKIDKVKYSVGKLSYKDLTESKVKLDTAKIDLVKSKNNLALYFLKRGL
jgi:hypothetical protein